VRKGIIVAGGENTRLYPTTRAVSKQLLPIYDKPMIYYPLATLMSAGIRDFLIIVRPRDRDNFWLLLENGSDLGISITYAEQEKANGIAEALRIGGTFIGEDPVALILGDNLFHGHGLVDLMAKADGRNTGATVFAKRVDEPEHYGVVLLDDAGRALELHEKPTTFVSNMAVTGLYFYDADAVNIAWDIQPSERGELEITDVNRVYLDRQQLNVERLDEDFLWLDTGTPDALAEATKIIKGIVQSQNSRVGCVEAIAFEKGYIDAEDIVRISKGIGSGSYSQHLSRLLGP
jgi:glucose-1-phosphate thymidylyltransferase